MVIFALKSMLSYCALFIPHFAIFPHGAVTYLFVAHFFYIAIALLSNAFNPGDF